MALPWAAYLQAVLTTPVYCTLRHHKYQCAGSIFFYLSNPSLDCRNSYSSHVSLCHTSLVLSLAPVLFYWQGFCLEKALCLLGSSDFDILLEIQYASGVFGLALKILRLPSF